MLLNRMSDELNISDQLAEFEPGKLPLDIFNQIARLNVLPVVEVVPFYRTEQGNIEVYLLQRDNDDNMWPGQYHIPGTIVSATDHAGSFKDAIDRIVNSRLSSFLPGNFQMVDVQLCKVSRGMEVAIVFMTELRISPDPKSLFDLNNLPENMIDGHEGFIKIAKQEFSQLPSS